MSLTATVFVDSSAALAVTARRGNGKLRHVRLGHLWVQELAASEEVWYRKIPGEQNPADLLTKHLPAHHRIFIAHAVAVPRGGRCECTPPLA